MKTVRMYVLVVLLCLALAITATVVWGRAQTTGQTDFQTNGNLIAGSYWLRSSGHTATWTFDVSQLQGRKVYINFNPLVTNGVNGGAGYDTTCKATVKIGPKTATMSIPVVNPYRPIDPANSGGVSDISVMGIALAQSLLLP